MTQDTMQAGLSPGQTTAWVVFAWCRVFVLILVASVLALLALQLVYDAVNYWGSYGGSTRDSVIEVTLGLVPLVVSLAVLVHRRRRHYSWLRSLRATFWVMLIVTLIPAYLGAMTTVI